jgi:acetyl-CoA C-acetyltransferase
VTRLPSGFGPLGERTPVLVGVGTATGDAEPVELMARALTAAGADAGAAGLVARTDRIAVPQGTWDYPDPARLVASVVGAGGAESHLVELGIPQQSLINQAMEAIAQGRSEVAVVVGGEAKGWARRRSVAGEPATETAQEGVVPDVFHRRPGELLEAVEVANRLWEPVQQYAMIDNALRHAEGRTVAEHRAEVAALWGRFNLVARDNPQAAFPAPMDASQLDTPSASNRPLAFPYNKWHSTQWTVDQAAALILCSAGEALRSGVAADRWVFPLVGLESSHAVSLLRRVEPWRWPAMEVLGAATAERIGRPLGRVEVIETYSCFPAAVRVQQRALGLGSESTPTITGGMAFAGGPFNNFVLQATAAVVRSLRAEGGGTGAVTTVSGLLTKPGIGVWTTSPDGRPPLVADLAPRAASATAVVDPGAVVATLNGYSGGVTVVTYTVTPDAQGLPSRTVVVCDTDDGRRCVAISEDRAVAAEATADELIGRPGRVAGGTFEPA